MRGRKMKRLTSILCTIGVTASIFSGCGAAKVETNTKEGKKLEGKIEFFQQKREAVKTFDAIIAKFNEEYPDIKVEQNCVPDAGKVLTTRIASGDTPDVFTIYPLASEFKAQCDQKYILDITDLNGAKNINPDIKKVLMNKDKLYSIPLSLNTMGVFYNKNMFKELNLEIPKTYDEFIKTLEKVKIAGKTPIVLPDKDSWTLGQCGDRLFGMYMTNEMDIFEQVGKDQKSCADSQGLNKLAKVMLELRNYGQPNTLGTGYDQAVAEFASGKSAMFYQGVWALPVITKANPSFEVGLFPFPSDKADETKISINIDCAVAAGAEGKNIELAKTFIDFLARKEIAEMYTKMDGLPSAIKDVKTQQKELDIVQKYISEGKTYPIPSNDWKPGFSQEWKKVIQNLIAKKDVNFFTKELDGMVKTYYKN